MIPKLSLRRDSDPMTGQVWVVDENNRTVASFKVRMPYLHLKGSQEPDGSDGVDAGLNMHLAQNLIDDLEMRWRASDEPAEGFV